MTKKERAKNIGIALLNEVAAVSVVVISLTLVLAGLRFVGSYEVLKTTGHNYLYAWLDLPLCFAWGNLGRDFYDCIIKKDKKKRAFYYYWWLNRVWKIQEQCLICNKDLNWNNCYEEHFNSKRQWDLWKQLGWDPRTPFKCADCGCLTNVCTKCDVAMQQEIIRLVQKHQLMVDVSKLACRNCMAGEL